MSNKYVEAFIPVVDAIAGTFGANCEVVLHNLANPEKSIIKIANGHITGREVGGPLTDLGLLLLEKGKKNGKTNPVVGYSTKTKRGTELKSTTVFIRNDKGKIVGCLCINIDITPYLSAKTVLEEFCTVCKEIEGGGESPELFEPSVDGLINELLRKTINEIGKPLAYMTKEDKLRIIIILKQKGLFLIKGSPKKLSKELNVSLPTIYKYLEEIRE